MWDELYEKLMSISSHVPVCELKCSRNGDIITKPPWDCTALKRKRKEKDVAWRNFDNNPNSVNLSHALHKQSEFEKKQSQKMILYEQKIVNNMKHNSKMFFGYLNSKRKLKSLFLPSNVKMVLSLPLQRRQQMSWPTSLLQHSPVSLLGHFRRLVISNLVTTGSLVKLKLLRGL